MTELMLTSRLRDREMLHRRERRKRATSKVPAILQPRHARRRLTALASWSAVAWFGCSGTPPVVTKPLPSPVVSRRAERLDPQILADANASTPADASSPAYKVDAGDSLLVAVYGHPELALSAYSGTGNPGVRGNGFVVDNDGSIQFPLIGAVHVAGKTLNELRTMLESQLAEFVREPKVTVQVLFPGSIRYYLLGQFASPGLKYSDRPLRLLEALSLGGSIELEKASLRKAYVARGDQRLPIDFRSLMREGDLRYNVPLHTGDIIFVPDSAEDQAFVFGGSDTSRGGAVPFINGRLDILQALSYAGLGFRDRFMGVLSETHVIRSEGDRGELFVVDVERILEGDAANFMLAPGDVVFVPTSGFTNFSLALQQLLPTLQTVSALLTPFVQIKYLQEN